MAYASTANVVIIIGALLFCSLHIDAKEWNDVDNCGKCKYKCPRAPPHSDRTCKQGKCGFKCNRGWQDCDMIMTNGCETDVKTDLLNCGRCNNVCPEPPRDGLGGRGGRGGGVVGEASCVKGVCGLSCGSSTGLANCDGVFSNGCEQDIWFDAQSCGRCRRVCPVPQNAADANCNLGRCTFSCMAGFADCDGDARNGCEVDLNAVSGPGQCGSCTTAADCALLYPYVNCGISGSCTN
ncbi:hypothetical protein M758_5G071100 [Ceratodon purpureus]|nr:hypothetical protein M758_5G071100 [Ceratodon purpureus]